MSDWFSDILGWFGGSSTPGATTTPGTPSTTPNSSGGFDFSSILSQFIPAAANLAGSVFGQKEQRRLAEQYSEAAARQHEQDLAWDREKFERSLAASQAASGAANALARKKAISDLYAEWAARTSEMGQARGKLSNDAASNMTAGMNVRANRLV